MARIRSIHPGQWNDDEFVLMSPLARLLCLALRNEADDQGVFEWKPARLKMQCLPLDNCDVTDLLGEMVSNNQIAQYEIDGRRYGAIRNFQMWQRPKSPNKVHPITSEIGKYIGSSGKAPVNGNGSTHAISETNDADAGNNGASTPPTSEIPPQMEEGGDNMEDGKGDVSASAPRRPSRRPPSLEIVSDEKVNHPPKQSTRGTRLPADWMPLDEDVARFKGPEFGFTAAEARREFEIFSDYWRSQPGARGVKVDWDGTYRNWMRRAFDDKQNKQQRSR